jgi:hypothetical protein
MHNLQHVEGCHIGGSQLDLLIQVSGVAVLQETLVTRDLQDLGAGSIKLGTQLIAQLLQSGTKARPAAAAGDEQVVSTTRTDPDAGPERQTTQPCLARSTPREKHD